MALTFFYRYLTSLKTTTSGTGSSAVATTDNWNIQGWLTSRTALKGSANVFTMSLGYYSPTVSGPVAKYFGDISSWTCFRQDVGTGRESSPRIGVFRNNSYLCKENKGSAYTAGLLFS